MDSPLALAGLGAAALTVSYCLGARSGGVSAPTIAVTVGNKMPDGSLQVVKNGGGAFVRSPCTHTPSAEPAFPGPF